MYCSNRVHTFPGDQCAYIHCSNRVHTFPGDQCAYVYTHTYVYTVLIDTHTLPGGIHNQYAYTYVLF